MHLAFPLWQLQPFKNATDFNLFASGARNQAVQVFHVHFVEWSSVDAKRSFAVCLLFFFVAKT
jgi:hypothetical protein